MTYLNASTSSSYISIDRNSFGRRYVDGSGASRVAGSTGLKASQHYPALFGRTIAETAIHHLSQSQANVAQRRP